MKNILFVIYVVLVWVLSMVNASGLGLVYETPSKTNLLILIWFWVVISKHKIRGILKSNSILVLCTILSFIIFPLMTAGSFEGCSYLMMLPLVYCFSRQDVNEAAINISGYIVAGLGLFIIYVYTHTDILYGWNDNHISMIVLFSYIYFSVSLYGNLSFKKITIGLVISLLYIIMLNRTESRSSIIFILLAVFLAYSGELFRKLVSKRVFAFYALNIPLFISLFCIFFSELPIFDYFENWSQENFGKSALNGRDTLWIDAYNRLFDSYLIGEGEFLINHHNSAVAVISVFGVIGYICWYKFFSKLICLMQNFVNDKLVFGFLSSFLLIFWQQSVELGFVCASPNMIPYMILGLGIARARKINTICCNQK